jgi:hypothetical protein
MEQLPNTEGLTPQVDPRESEQSKPNRATLIGGFGEKLIITAGVALISIVISRLIPAGKTAQAIIVNVIVLVMGLALWQIDRFRKLVGSLAFPLLLLFLASATLNVMQYLANRDANSIEGRSFEVIPYTFGSYAAEGTTYLKVIHDDKGHNDYDFEYSLLKADGTWVGVVFRFDKPEDLAKFNYIEIEITFEDDEAVSDLFIKDVNMSPNVETVPIGAKVMDQEGIVRTTVGNTHTIKIPLRPHFEHVNFEVVKEIGFSIGTYTPESLSFVIRDIRFLE